jgi:3-methylcrotonyl-CoA carboxylase alpha subunit
MSGSMEGNELKAFIGDRLINATVVMHNNILNVFYEGNNYQLTIPVKNYNAGAAVKGSLLSPMPGRVVKILVQPNEKVVKGAPLMIMEAMKMEVSSFNSLFSLQQSMK